MRLRRNVFRVNLAAARLAGSPPSTALTGPAASRGERVERAEDFWCAPCSVAGAVGEFDDDSGGGQRVDVSAGVAGRYAEFTLEELRVEDRVLDEQVGDVMNSGVPPGGDPGIPLFAN
jgi:hypothetical protein